MRLMRFSLFLFLLTMLGFPVITQAIDDSLKFSLQRLTYIAGDNSVSMSLRNTSQSPYLIQANMLWLDESTGLNTLDKSEKIPFTVTPPLYKLSSDEYYSWRVLFTGKTPSLPTDRESVFLLQLKAIPSTEPQHDESMQFTVTRSLLFKVYYRPANLKGMTLEQVSNQLSFRRENNYLVVKNNSPIYATFDNLSINGIPADSDILFMSVAPYSEQRYPFKQLIAGTISWALMDEYLLPTKQKNSLVQ
ncbi:MULTISPECIES: molecular chaperone [Providencia]|uniref:fimbrial biogenesis chaperone n=1 Tax=Providencia TaxID=586 RepID=UPI0015EC5799|nr:MULTISPECIES: molecular chaperone [Providencia]QLR03350.1 molecular chaperone [Providencia rettgeri]